MQIELSFWGLCALIERDNGYEVVLPTGKVVPAGDDCKPTVAPHVGTLAVAVPKNPADLSGTWTATSVVAHGDVQLACFSIPEGVHISVTSPAKKPTWPDRHKSIYFPDEHPNNPAKTSGELKDLGYSVFLLGEGTINGTVEKKIKVNGTSRDLARRVTWRSTKAPVTITRHDTNDTIIIGDKGMASVTNVSTTRSTGHEHFAFYYTILRNGVACDKRLVLTHHQHNFTGPDVYDCVPPVGGS